MIKIAPTGRLTKGHVLDVNQKHFDRALQFYDKFLYTKWNPKKLGGYGCWEIRRKPEQSSIVSCWDLDDCKIMVVQPKEYDLVHHVLDCAFLNYDQIRKLKEMDTFENKNHIFHKSNIDSLDAREEAKQKEIEDKANAELMYNLKQERSAMNDLYNRYIKGENAARIVSETDWAAPSERK